MTRKQRETKELYRSWWRHRGGRMTYPVFLESELLRCEEESKELHRRMWEMERRYDRFADYIFDIESGMRLVERVSGTMDVRTTIPVLTSNDNGEAVRKAIIWLWKTVDAAKKEFQKRIGVPPANGV